VASVRLEKLVKRFGNVTAIDNLDLEIFDTEFVVLLGPSGCGKSTALRCVAGLETPDSGSVYIGDRLMNDLPPKDRDVAMVFQSYALYPHMNVRDNIGFPLRMKKLGREDVNARVKKVADLLRISELLERKPKQLSGGQAQRVALGRAIVREPKAFLMDEPLSNLDAKLRTYMRAELKRLQKDLGITTIYVTHDQAEAMTMGDRVAVMKSGKLQQLASAEEIYSKPRNLFVAGFLGSPPMNFISCTLKKGTLVESEIFSLRLSRAVKTGLTSRKVTLGFRPEDVTLYREEITGGMEAEVYMYEPLGSEIIVDLKAGQDLIKAKVGPEFKLKIGDKVWFTVNEKAVHLFDQETDEAMA
jgi:multiple sugar transport system ATP-binding protein